MTNNTKTHSSSFSNDETGFCAWLGQALPGDTFEYHRGFLLLDSAPGISLLSGNKRAELVRLRKRALWAADQSLTHLIQKRHGPDDYSYLAIARPRPASTPVALIDLMTKEAA